MKKFLGLLSLLVAMTITGQAYAGGGGAVGQKFVKQIYFKFGGSSSNSGSSYQAAKPIADGTVWAIPAGTLIEHVYVIIDTAVTGTTDFDVGDDDDSDGFVDGSLSLTLGTTGMYGWDAKLAGAYLRIQTAGATDAGDIYVVPAAKYYKAAGKSIIVDATTTNTAGAFRVVIEGFYAGSK